MAIARKPSRQAGPAVDVKALINRGGGVPVRRVKSQSKTATILLRVPPDLLRRMEIALLSRPVQLPRHTWILEAIHEKLSRELPER